MLEILHGPRAQAISRGLLGKSGTGLASWTRTRSVRSIVCTAKVYISASHLEGMERAQSLLTAIAPGIQDLITLHTMTIIEEVVEGDTSLKAYTLFDFLPLRATSPATAATLLAGGKWPGLKRERQMRRLPKHRCRYIGEATVPRATEAARQFNATWESDIQLLRHDCHHHTASLVHVLTGEEIHVSKLFPLQQDTVWM